MATTYSLIVRFIHTEGGYGLLTLYYCIMRGRLFFLTQNPGSLLKFQPELQGTGQQEIYAQHR